MKTDICIIGGGLAGLTAALGALRLGFSVVLLEKKTYPFHKVCGEYISMEAMDLLEWMDLPVSWETLPHIRNFGFSNTGGQKFSSSLPAGGIGISRHLLDHEIQKKIILEGGTVLEGTRAHSFRRTEDGYLVGTDSHALPEIRASWVLGAMGRNKTRFAGSGNGEGENPRYLGVKRHIIADLPADRIELHAFPGGYCGISAVEAGRYCLCYLIRESHFTDKPEQMEREILSRNPVLNHYLRNFEAVTPRVTTAGVFFSPRPIHQDGMLFLGDSAGMIPPLAGNGMSMAMHSAVLALKVLMQARKHRLKEESFTQLYQTLWRSEFSTRLRMAGALQRVMEEPMMSKMFAGLFSVFPGLFKGSVRLTHGKKIPLPGY